MSFDDYVHQITQKYRLAVAIAIIKTKPDNISMEQYVEQLKNKIGNEKMDVDDSDITICSDDFDFDDDDIVINEEYIGIDDNFVASNNNLVRNDDQIITNDDDFIQNVDDLIIREDYAQINDTQITDSIDILQETNLIKTVNYDRNTNSCDVSAELKAVNDEGVDKTPNADTQTTYCESLKSQELTTNTVTIITDNPYSGNIDISNKNIVSNNIRPKIVTTVTDNIKPFDSQETEIYTVHGFTQKCTHYSQSQDANVIIGNKYIVAKDQHNNKDNEMNNEEPHIDHNENPIYTQYAQNMDFYLNESHIISDNSNTLEVENANNFNEIDSIGQSNRDLDENENSHLECQNSSKYPKETNEEVNNELNDDFFEETCDITDSQKEIVPFKVIEELNKVKMFLNKKPEWRFSTDGHSTDSGYRSDSQSKSSNKSALQLSGTWLNQSAHSLFNYLTGCPLVATTQHITQEIAQVIGQLVDRLHEEEKYPSFLEELLDSVELLLRQIYDEDSSCDNVLLKKDEEMQRLFLLNQSVHIQKYTLEKITNILENLQSKLTDSDSVYEITNINEIENVCYIFYILEIIIIKYTKARHNSSQSSSQLSQDSEKLLRKSSVSDIWRKKWNPNYKELKIEESVEKKCVLLKCSEILNRIIVGCMDGYSLLAYSALKCFNLLQT